MRYTRQRRSYDCGAAAITNALKWAGHKISYRDEGIHLMEKLQWKPKRRTQGYVRGSDTLHMIEVISSYEQLKIKKVFIDKCSKNQLESHLKKGRTAIICYVKSAGKFGSHAFFVEDMSEHYYHCVNMWADTTRSFLNKDWFHDHIKKDFPVQHATIVIILEK